MDRLGKTFKRWRRSVKRAFSSLASMSGRCRKAVAAAWASGGMTALGMWYETGKLSDIALRGIVVGVFTGITTYYIPNDDVRQPDPDQPSVSSDPPSSSLGP